MKCIAVDDEPLALALLQDNIRQVPALELVASCSTAMEALAILNRQEVDLDFPGYTNARAYGIAAYSNRFQSNPWSS